MADGITSPDLATHRVVIGRGSYVMVLDPDGNVVGKVDVGKDNEAHAVARAPDLQLAFTSNGGVIFAEACCGSKEFDKGFRALMKDRHLFPDHELDVLGVAVSYARRPAASPTM